MCIEIKNNHFELLAERAIFWEEEKALICSDLHWGRELLLQKFGMPIPERSFEQEAAFIEHLLMTTKAKEWWILGDFIHHPQGLDQQLVNRMYDWMIKILRNHIRHIRFIPGNHDRNYLSWVTYFPFDIEENGIFKGDFQFLHEPPHGLAPPQPEKFTWYGHIHPAIRPPMLGHKKLPCFWIRENEGFLPAFSRLAGGAEIRPEDTDSVFVIADQQVIQIY